MARVRTTTQLAMQVGRDLAAELTRAIEERRQTISDVLAYGLSLAMQNYGEHELAAMLLNGRGTEPKYPHRFRKR